MMLSDQAGTRDGMAAARATLTLHRGVMVKSSFESCLGPGCHTGKPIKALYSRAAASSSASGSDRRQSGSDRAARLPADCVAQTATATTDRCNKAGCWLHECTACRGRRAAALCGTGRWHTGAVNAGPFKERHKRHKSGTSHTRHSASSQPIRCVQASDARRMPQACFRTEGAPRGALWCTRRPATRARRIRMRQRPALFLAIQPTSASAYSKAHTATTPHQPTCIIMIAANFALLALLATSVVAAPSKQYGGYNAAPAATPAGNRTARATTASLLRSLSHAEPPQGRRAHSRCHLRQGLLRQARRGACDHAEPSQGCRAHHHSRGHSLCWQAQVPRQDHHCRRRGDSRRDACDHAEPAQGCRAHSCRQGLRIVRRQLALWRDSRCCCQPLWRDSRCRGGSLVHWICRGTQEVPQAQLRRCQAQGCRDHSLL
ncbi:hypothetical protein BC831DRAFT_239302 [Entophlyctis helioformis]|nr:hypothetical protein BC831DRAFT_239302 [Entophlyctis helioformis]